MALTLVSQPEYKIDTPGFAQHRFTESSQQYLALPDAVQFASVRSGVLQSAREAIAFRLAAKGAEDANLYQATRTAALYIRDRGQCYVAFDDDPTENILLARAQEGHASHQHNGKWLVHKDDKLITGALQRAAKTSRILPVPLENTVRLTTVDQSGTSEYASNRLIRATIGDVAPAYAQFLNQKGFKTAYEWLLTAGNLDQLGVDNNHVEVRRVGVGGSDCSNINNLYANDLCYYNGRARGVRENSTGNKG